MKQILVISDLHFDFLTQNRGYKRVITKFIKQLTTFLLTNRIDGLIIAGDISRDLDDVEKLFNALQPLELPKIYVPGNHELFLDIDIQTLVPPDELTNPIMNYILGDGRMDMSIAGDGVNRLWTLTRIAEENHVSMLHEEPIILFERPKTVIIGNMGWYNYEQPFENLVSPDILKKKQDAIDLDRLFDSDEGHNYKGHSYKLQFFDPNTLFWKYLYMCVKYQIQLIKQMEFEHLLFLSHYIPLSNCIPYKRSLDVFDHILKNEKAYKWFYAQVTDLIQQSGLKIDAYIFGHRHSPCRNAAYICNPFVKSSHLQKNGEQAYHPRYNDDFTRYFQAGLFNLE